jgi:hypothetical protein
MPLRLAAAVNDTTYLVSISGTALGFIGHSYRYLAHHFDWPSGAAFTDDIGFARLSSILIVLMPSIEWGHSGAMLAMSVFLVGCAVAYAVMLLLGHRAQILWAVGTLGLGAYSLWAVLTRFVVWPAHLKAEGRPAWAALFAWRMPAHRFHSFTASPSSPLSLTPATPSSDFASGSINMTPAASNPRRHLCNVESLGFYLRQPAPHSRI